MGVRGGVDITLSTFGGLSTELSAADIPDGGSPDNSDIAFVPGSCMTREGLRRIYSTPPDSTAVMWQDNFTNTDGAIFNVWLCASGKCWLENFSDNPGVFTNPFSVTPNSYCVSSKIPSGRMYMAFNDGMNGTDISRWMDGSNWGRISQDGPCFNPTYGESIVSASTLATTASGTSVNINTVTLSGASQTYESYYYNGKNWVTDYHLVFYQATVVTATPHNIPDGATVLITGNSYNGQYVATVIDATSFVIKFPNGIGYGPDATGGTVGIPGSSLSRTANIVTANTSSDHGMVIGDMFDVSDVSNEIIGTSITSLSRKDNIVTVTTASSNGVRVRNKIKIDGVPDDATGVGISSIVCASFYTTVTTAQENNVAVGDYVAIANVSNAAFNGGYYVTKVTSPNQFVLYTPDITDGTSSGGSVYGATNGFNGTWEITSVLSPTQFQFETLNLPDATAAGGFLYAIWNKTKRYVQTVISDTSFTYEDNGPDAFTGNTGTITPRGQLEGGIRYAVCMFELSDGFITPPSDPVRVVTSGNKKMTLQNIPIGPSNVVKRIIAMTAADGSSYFFIPTPARNGNYTISTSTVIDDNTSTTAVFDFSDITLTQAANQIDADDYNLFELRVIGNASKCAYYASRMLYSGDENTARGFKNMGFEGGTANNDGVTPAGWSVTGNSHSVITSGDFGDAIEFSSGVTQSILSQQASKNYWGNQILEPSKKYRFKCWCKYTDTTGATSVPQIVATLYNNSTSAVIATATITPETTGEFKEAVFSAALPATVDLNTYLSITVTNMASTAGMSVIIDEMKLVYDDRPWDNKQWYGSYPNDYSTVCNLDGNIGATNDSTPIMDFGILRDNFYFVTQRKLHTFKDMSNSQPSLWDVNMIADRCGADSFFTMSSGESWLTWANKNGCYIFDGGRPVKITQDIQNLWNSINGTYFHIVRSVNDPETRRMYFSVPIGSSTTPNKVIVLDYRYSDVADAIADKASVRVSPYTGKMLVTDLARKFSPWTIAATSMAFMQTSSGNVLTFGDASGRIYRLDASKYSDDDYGEIPAYYVTSFFVGEDEEIARQLSQHLNLFSYFTILCTGIGTLKITPLADTLDNAYPSRFRAFVDGLQYEYEFIMETTAYRCAYRIEAVPASGTDSYFAVNRLCATAKQHPHGQLRGNY